MRATQAWVLAMAVATVGAGCGGVSQDDMRRRALRRPKSPEAEDVVAAVQPASPPTSQAAHEPAPPPLASPPKTTRSSAAGGASFEIPPSRRARSIDAAEDLAFELPRSQRAAHEADLENLPPAEVPRSARRELEESAADPSRQPRQAPNRAGATETAADELAAAARAMIAEGRERDGFQLYYASLLCRESPAAWLADFRWTAALQRPALALRFGVGVHYVGPRGNHGLAPAADQSVAGRIRKGQGQNQLKQFTDGLGSLVVDELSALVEAGNCGLLLVETAARPRSIRSSGAASQQPALQTDLLTRGVTYLGEGNRRALLHVAGQEGIDVLLLFEVHARPTRTGTASKNIDFSLLDAMKEKTLHESATLNNLRAMQARRDPTADDPVGDALEKLRAYLQSYLRLEEMPPLKPQHAAGRVSLLIGESHDQPLPVLAEIRMYRSRGLIDEAAWLAACRSLLGEDAGSQLATGSEHQREQAVSSWLPRAERARR